MRTETAVRPRSMPLLATPTNEEYWCEGSLILRNLLSAAECALLARRLANLPTRDPLEWTKDWAATERFLFELAIRPELLNLLRSLLGEGIILWGASPIHRAPGQEHPWHTDIESSATDGRFVSIWIGLRHTGSESGLRLIPGSHRFGKPIQCELHDCGLTRATDAQALELARKHDVNATITAPDMCNGDAILFDGRLWHASRNGLDVERVAVLLQYAAADQPVYRLDSSQLNWPFRFFESPRPPVITVSGGPGNAGNWIVPPPEPDALPDITTSINRLELPLAEDRARGWRPYPLFCGVTPNIDFMRCHVSVLSPGHSPHPPHVHHEEELLIVLDGAAELILAKGVDDPAPRVEPAVAGVFAYYPAGQHHTIRSVDSQPVTYLMFKWRSAPVGSDAALPAQITDLRRAMPFGSTAPVDTRLLFEAPTAMIGKLHAHVTEIQPGGGYNAHIDWHDVAIVTLAGRVGTLDEEAGPHSVIYYAAGQRHGMRNIGEEPARYLAFEFHAPVSDRVHSMFTDTRGKPVDPDRFDAAWYLARNRDVAASGMDPYEHYRQYGAAEGRLPSETVYHELTAALDFDAAWYLQEYEDVRTAGADPLVHFVRFGFREGRSARPDIRASGTERAPADSSNMGKAADTAQRVAAYRLAVPSRKRRIVMCTAIFGEYDTLRLPDLLDPEIDYVCFTDSPLEDHGVWELRPPVYRNADAARMTRYVKTHLVDLFPLHETAIWIDGNVQMCGDVQEYVKRLCRESAAVGMMVHPRRRCVYDEAEMCKRLNKDAPDLIDRQMARYRRLGLKPEAGLYEMNFFVARLNSTDTARFLNLWWREIEAFSRRDQLSVVWAAAQAGIQICHLLPPGVSTRNHPDFVVLEHRQSDTLSRLGRP